MSCNRLADLGDGPTIVVVIAKHEVNRNAEAELYLSQKLYDGIGFADITAEQKGIELLFANQIVEPRSLARGYKVQMDVGKPAGPHAHSIAAKTRYGDQARRLALYNSSSGW